MQNNLYPKPLGMKWFNFFYKFSLPLGILVAIGNIITAIESKYYLDVVLQAICVILNIILIVAFWTRKKTTNSLKQSINIYYLTLLYIAVMMIVNSLYNPTGILAYILYFVLNFIYFNKRKFMFNLNK